MTPRPRIVLLFGLFASVASASPALAQDAQPAQAGTEDAAGAGGAGEDTSSESPAAATDDAPVATASPAAEAAMKRSRPLIARGEALFEAENYEAALAEFERAYSELAGHPRRFETLYNIGLCQERLFRYDRALDAYRRYLKEGGDRVEDRAMVEATIKALLGLLGKLRVRSNVPAEVWVDDVLIGRAPGELYVAGGRHTVELRADGYQSVQREINLSARGHVALDVDLRPTDTAEGLPPALFWTGLGLTVAAAGVGVGFGMSAKSQSDDAKTRERHVVDGLENTTGTKRDIEDAGLIANVSFLTAGVLAVGTTLLFLMTDWGGDEPGEVALVPVVGARGEGAALQLRRRF